MLTNLWYLFIYFFFFLHLQILNGEPSDDNHQLLSYITSTFSAIEEQIHDSRLRRRKWELSYLPCGKPGTAPRPLGGALSFSTGNLDQVGSKLRPFRRTSELSVSSIPEEEVEIHEVLLEKYSDRLLEMVAKKLKQWGILSCCEHNRREFSFFETVWLGKWVGFD